jgi:hypothetical protein
MGNEWAYLKRMLLTEIVFSKDARCQSDQAQTRRFATPITHHRFSIRIGLFRKVPFANASVELEPLYGQQHHAVI